MLEKPKKRRRNVLWNPSRRMGIRRFYAKERLLESQDEFKSALRVLDHYPKRVTFFGSARDLPSNQKYRDAAYEIAYKLAKDNYAMVSGGGGGVMAASNKGAYDAGGVSIGFNIALPKEQKLNPYTTHNFSFHYFFTRKVTMTFFSHAYIYFPGGFGTLDEFTEVLTLIQTKKMPPLRIILFGSDYWQPLDTFFREKLLAQGFVSKGDEKLYTICDDIDEVVYLVNTGFDN